MFSDVDFQQLFIFHLHLVLSDQNCISVGLLYYIFFYYEIQFLLLRHTPKLTAGSRFAHSSCLRGILLVIPPPVCSASSTPFVPLTGNFQLIFFFFFLKNVAQILRRGTYFITCLGSMLKCCTVQLISLETVISIKLAISDSYSPSRN